jgi:hypothetical protein
MADLKGNQLEGSMKFKGRHKVSGTWASFVALDSFPAPNENVPIHIEKGTSTSLTRPEAYLLPISAFRSPANEIPLFTLLGESPAAVQKENPFQ